MKKLLVIQVAALGYRLLEENGKLVWEDMEFRPAASVLPAVTCSVQASFRTATQPGRHGMVANGLFFRQLGRTAFWEQSSRLVEGPRIWEQFRAAGGKVGMMFWQQSMGEDVDLLLTPAPIHKHHGGMIQDCCCRPAGLYKKLCDAVGSSFRLRHYWGPLASAKAGDWIAAATEAVLRDRETAPHLLLTYLPSLDYDLQRFGPHHEKSRASLSQTLQQLARMKAAARDEGYDVLIFGDYAIDDVSEAVFPNVALLEAGLMTARDVRGMLYADLHASRAFAVVDHQVANVYVRDVSDVRKVRQTLEQLDGVAEVLDRSEQTARGLGHANSGELLLLAGPDCWLAYPWWRENRRRPDYATHVDIHAKPGYDPCELFFGWPPPSVSMNVEKIRGSHGLNGPGREAAWATTLPADACTIVELAEAVKRYLEQT